MLLLKKDLSKLLKFYWKKEQILSCQKRFGILFLTLLVGSFYLFENILVKLTKCIFSFSLSFSFKNGETPLYIAAREGHQQIVQILLKKRRMKS